MGTFKVDTHEDKMARLEAAQMAVARTGGIARDMTLRDHFAGQALAAIISHTELVEDGKFLAGPAPGTSAIENFAEFSYLCADAMLAARKAGQ